MSCVDVVKNHLTDGSGLIIRFFIVLPCSLEGFYESIGYRDPGFPHGFLSGL
jgi:hypothetical protein